ncbi:MAG TPA: transferase, partial [Candidatus Omnitrophota bacterium]|nr:transferase [Candidatus Omnitrophota bacterium]
QGSTVSVGPRSSLSHGCVVHGPCEIGDGSFVGFGAVVFCSTLAGNIFVGHLALVVGVKIPAGCSVPDHQKVKSSADVKKLVAISREQGEFIAGVVQMNKKLVNGYKGFSS